MRAFALASLAASLTCQAATSVDKELKSCNAAPVGQVKQFWNAAVSLPRPTDAFGASSAFIAKAEAIKARTKPLTFYSRAFTEYTNGQPTPCSSAVVEYDIPKRFASFRSPFNWVEWGWSRCLQGMRCYPSLTLHRESKFLGEHKATNAYGVSTTITVHDEASWTAVFTQQADLPRFLSYDAVKTVPLEPEAARAILPRLVMKVVIEPIIDVGADSQALTEPRNRPATLDRPHEFRDRTNYLRGRLLEFEVFDPESGEVFMTLADLDSRRQELDAKPGNRTATP